MPPDRILHIDGHRVRVRELGASQPGPVMLLIHGLGVSGTYMLPLARELARHHRVLLPDLPGHGESSTPPAVPDERDHARIVVEVARQLADGEDVVLVGNSWGSQIALEACIAAPEQVVAAVLLGPTVDPRHPSIITHAARLGLLTFLEPPRLDLLVLLTYLRTGVLRTIREFRHAQRHDMLGAARRVRQPVLVADGDLDPIITNAWVDQLAAALPRSATASLHDAAHVLNWRPADRVAAAIEAFLTARLGDTPFMGERRGDTPPEPDVERSAAWALEEPSHRSQRISRTRRPPG
ncbi:MAG: alpha/beta hydrolase [Thermoleophilia bacterium]|nr:alpha/beta hydrolase [Thermoleophilia bacterium]